MIKIPLGKSDAFALIDDEDFDLVNQYQWYLGKGYAIGSWDPTIRMQRLVMNAPKGLLVDHINHNKLDNRKANLRLCTASENLFNVQMDGRGYKGVTFSKGKDQWIASIGYKKRLHYLGGYRTLIHALMARDMAAKELHGEFAVLNFPNGIHGGNL